MQAHHENIGGIKNSSRENMTHSTHEASNLKSKNSHMHNIIHHSQRYSQPLRKLEDIPKASNIPFHDK